MTNVSCQTFLGLSPLFRKHSNRNNEIDGMVEKPKLDKHHLKCDCINRSTINGTKKPYLYRFVSDLGTLE